MHIAAQIEQLIELHGLPADFSTTVNETYQPLAQHIAETSALRFTQQHPQPMVVGISGAQGTGKSTLSAFLQMLLEKCHNLTCAQISLDDLYLTQQQRKDLAERVHPLLCTRGVPGTHDISLGLGLLQSLRDEKSVTQIPGFDKAIDDRLAPEQWTSFNGQPKIIILEGWCLGAKAQQNVDDPINDLERNEDSDGRWRNFVNSQLDTSYQQLFEQIDTLIVLQAPSMERVRDWRELQEQKLAKRTTNIHRPTMTGEQLRQFIMHFERITRAMLDELPGRADIILELDNDHRITNTVHKKFVPTVNAKP